MYFSKFQFERLIRRGTPKIRILRVLGKTVDNYDYLPTLSIIPEEVIKQKCKPLLFLLILFLLIQTGFIFSTMSNAFLDSMYFIEFLLLLVVFVLLLITLSFFVILIVLPILDMDYRNISWLNSYALSALILNLLYLSEFKTMLPVSVMLYVLSLLILMRGYRFLTEAEYKRLQNAYFSIFW